MAKQTAVQWLQEQLNPDMKTMQGNIMQDLIEQAKQIEKEDIQRAYYEGYYDASNKLAKDDKYYEENYED